MRGVVVEFIYQKVMSSLGYFRKCAAVNAQPDGLVMANRLSLRAMHVCSRATTPPGRRSQLCVVPTGSVHGPSLGLGVALVRCVSSLKPWRPCTHIIHEFTIFCLSEERPTSSMLSVLTAFLLLFRCGPASPCSFNARCRHGAATTTQKRH